MSVLIIVGIVVVVIIIAAACTPSDHSESAPPPPPQTVVIREPERRDPHKYIDKRNHRYDARNERHRNNRETYPW